MKTKKEVIEKEIENEISNAQKEIVELKNSISSIQNISINVASNIIENITGDKLNESSIKAAVEEISKKYWKIFMTIDATFLGTVSFLIFIGVLIYFKIPQKVKAV